MTVFVLQSIGSKWWPRNYIGVLCSGLLCYLSLISYITSSEDETEDLRHLLFS